MPTPQQIADFLSENSSNPKAIAEARAAHPEVTDAQINAATRLLVIQYGNDPNAGFDQWANIGEGLGYSPAEVKTFLASPVSRAPLTAAELGIPVSPAATVPANPALGLGIFQSYSPIAYAPAAGDHGVPNADPLIGGRQYRTLFHANETGDPNQLPDGGYLPNNPDTLAAEISSLRAAGANPINHPQYGWIAEQGPAFDAVHDPNYYAKHEGWLSKLFTLGPILIPAILTGSGALAGLDSMAGAAVAGAVETSGAGFTAGVDFLPDAVEMIGGGHGVLSGGAISEIIVNPFTSGLDFLPDAEEMIGGGQGVLSGGAMVGSGAAIGSLGSTALVSKAAAAITSVAAAVGSKIAAAALTSALTPAPRTREAITPLPLRIGPAPGAPGSDPVAQSSGLLPLLALAVAGFLALKGG